MLDAIDQAVDVFRQAMADFTEQSLSQPSALPGWSRRHVIAHVALNADGLVAVARHRTGETTYMYPAGAADRDSEIDVLAAGPTSNLFSRWAAGNIRFREAWSSPIPEHRCATAPGHPTFSSATVPLRRLRELQVHLLDLNIEGIGSDVWLDAFVEADLPLQWPTVEHRTAQPVRVVDELGRLWHAAPPSKKAAAVHVTRRSLLAWVLDRAVITGLPRLEAWTNRSQWEHLGTS